MNNSTATSPLDYQWSPWKRPVKGQFPVSTNHLPLTYRRHVYVQEDLLASDVPVDWLVRFLSLIHSTHGITWLLSTFRPSDWLGRVDNKALLKLEMEKDRETLALREWLRAWIEGTPPSNVWVGSPISSQQQADSLIPKLLSIPAVGRFLLCDPLVGPVDLQLEADPPRMPSLKTGHRPDWVAIGGESGHGARPCNVKWIRSIVHQCRDASVPCFVKQLGARPLLNPCRQHHFDWRHKTANADRPDDALFKEDIGDPGMWRILLTHPKGGDPAEWPADLRVREFPEGLR